jgi:hypothetical protein
MKAYPQAHLEINQRHFALQYTLVFIASTALSHLLAETEWILFRMVTFSGKKSKGCQDIHQ